MSIELLLLSVGAGNSSDFLPGLVVTCFSLLEKADELDDRVVLKLYSWDGDAGDNCELGEI